MVSDLAREGRSVVSVVGQDNGQGNGQVLEWDIWLMFVERYVHTNIYAGVNTRIGQWRGQ